MKKRKKDGASSHLIFCYTGDELIRYRDGKIEPEERTQIYHHLNVEKCERCRGLYELLEETSDEEMDAPVLDTRAIIDRLKKKQETFQELAIPINIERGQVWTTSPNPSNTRGLPTEGVPIALPVLVVYSDDGRKSLDNIIRVIPISFDTDFFMAGESVVLEEYGSLTFPVLLEVFNEKPMLAGNLEVYKGSVSREDMERIDVSRRQFMEGHTSSDLDKEYLEWKKKEFELTEYLSFPVNDSLWEKELEIISEPFRKAADTSGIELSEIKIHLLEENDDFSLTVVQKRDRFILRYISEKSVPEYVRLSGNLLELKEVSPCQYEATIGYVGQMPEIEEIELNVNKNELIFRARFVEL